MFVHLIPMICRDDFCITRTTVIVSNDEVAEFRL